jgi:hypothetical protein
MKFRGITVRWYDVVFWVAVPVAYYFLNNSPITGGDDYFPLTGLMFPLTGLMILSYACFMQMRQQSHSDSNSDGGSS